MSQYFFGTAVKTQLPAATLNGGDEGSGTREDITRHLLVTRPAMTVVRDTSTPAPVGNNPVRTNSEEAEQDN